MLCKSLLPFILPAIPGSVGSTRVTVQKVTHDRRQETRGLGVTWEALQPEKSDPYFLQSSLGLTNMRFTLGALAGWLSLQ